MDPKSTMKSDPLPRKQSAVWAAMKTVKTKLSLTDEGASPINWKVIFLVFLSLFSSSFNITFIFPFLPEMIRSFGYKEEEKGFYSGLVASALFIGRTFGSYFWGWLSDRKGRKPIILLTLLLNGAFSFAFGFTTNIYFAIIMRILAGLANGTVGTAKTVLYEISDNTNQAVGMSIISIAWGTGLIIGPAIGGYTANPCKQYPNVFPSEGFLYDFPYIFPGICSFVLCVIAFTVDVFFLPETLNKKRDMTMDLEAEEGYIDEKTSLNSSPGVLQGSPPRLHATPSYLRANSAPTAALSVENLHVESEGATYLAGSRKEIHISMKGITFVDNKPEGEKPVRHRNRTISACNDTNHHGQFYVEGETCKCSQSSENIREKQQSNGHTVGSGTNVSEALLEKSHQKGAVHGHSQSDSAEGSGCWHKFKNWSPIKLLRQSDVFLAIFQYSVFSFSVIGMEEIFTVWSSTDVLLDGLGFQPQQIGTVLGSTSLPLLFLQLLIFPNVVRRIGIKWTLVLCSLLLAVFTQVLPLLHLLVNRPVALWVLLLSVYTFIKLMISCAFSCTGLMINNSVTPDMAGSVNGLSMTVTAITRSFAPIIGGSMFTWVVGYASENIGPPFDVSLVFFMFGLVYWIVSAVGVFTPASLNLQKK